MCEHSLWKAETAWKHTCSVRHQHKCHTLVNTLLSIGCCVGCLSSAPSRLFPLWVNVSYAWRWMENKAEWHFWTNESSDSQPELTFLLPCPHTLFKRARGRAINPVSCPSPVYPVINPVWPYKRWTNWWSLPKKSNRETQRARALSLTSKHVLFQRLCKNRSRLKGGSWRHQRANFFLQVGLVWTLNFKPAVSWRCF